MIFKDLLTRIDGNDFAFLFLTSERIDIGTPTRIHLLIPEGGEEKSLSIPLPSVPRLVNPLARARARSVEPFFRNRRQKLTVHSTSRRLFDYYIRRWVNAGRKSCNSLRFIYIYRQRRRYTRPPPFKVNAPCINHGSVNYTIY